MSAFSADSPLLSLRPIGVVRSPFQDRLAAPRQPRSSGAAEGTIELYPVSGVEHALEDLESFRFIWVVFWFDRNPGFRPKVLPPRSRRRRGVFATRSPYRPNPIGLSAVELIRIDRLVLHVRGLDILDQTPVLDIKPYVPYTDNIPEASSGWLDTAAQPEDPLPEHAVRFLPRALDQLAFLEAEHGIFLRLPVEEVLRLGPQPHPYRRIKRQGGTWVLAHKQWRLGFRLEGDVICVTEVWSGYRASELFQSTDSALAPHREFTARYPRRVLG
jgi:tRNA-Thr(GGU) m(6)t(6)A37 methyltransferase TsaA